MKLALAFLLLASPLSAQRLLDPDTCFTCKDSREHFAATALLDAGAQVLFPKWKPWQRVLLTGGLIGGVWEAGQMDAAHALGASGRPGFGFSFKDLACDILGAWAMEGLWAIGRKIL